MGECVWDRGEVCRDDDCQLRCKYSDPTIIYRERDGFSSRGLT